MDIYNTLEPSNTVAKINPRKVQFRENGQWNNHNSEMHRLVEFDVGLTTATRR